MVIVSYFFGTQPVVLIKGFLIITYCVYKGCQRMQKIRRVSHSQYFEIFVVANCDPIRLSCSPLDLVNFTLGSVVGQNGIFYWSWHLLDIPYQSLVIVPCCTYMAR